MKIWVDADACPKPIKEILYRAANRLQIVTVLVANQNLSVPTSPYIQMTRVDSGYDQADKYIMQMTQSRDIIITADIPMAAEVIAKGAVVLTPRGRVYTEENIGEQLSIRNFMDELRGNGVQTGGPPPLNMRDREEFSNQLQKLINSRF